MSNSLIEFDIERPIKVSQLLNDLLVYLHVSPALRLAQAARLAAALRLLQAGEAFGSVEVEVLVRDNAFESQEVLHSAKFPCWVCDQALPAHKVHLREAKVLQPVLQVQDVHSDANGVPRSVDKTQASVLEGQLLKGRDVRLLGKSLGVVGDGSGDWVTHHND